MCVAGDNSRMNHLDEKKLAPTFQTPAEEVKYWKDMASYYKEEAKRLRIDSDEFTATSRQLEKEFETQIEENERKIRVLTVSNETSQADLKAFKRKLEENLDHVTQLESELATLLANKAETAEYIRQLEQKNDDLERSRRIIEESIASVEEAFHSAIERNVFLESELDEKEVLRDQLQRLADETRDLRQELLVKEKAAAAAAISSDGGGSLLNGFKKNRIMDATNRLKETETQTSPAKKLDDTVGYQGRMSPATRVAALNIVSDLIRKVGLSRYLCVHCGRYKCTVCTVNSAGTQQLDTNNSRT